MAYVHEHTVYMTIGGNEREVCISYTMTPGWGGDREDPGYPADCTIERVEVEVLTGERFGKPMVKSWEPAPKWMIDIIENDEAIHADMVEEASATVSSARADHERDMRRDAA